MFARPTAIFLISFFLACTTNQIVSVKQDKPNILLILADDLGFGDLSCYNDHSLIETPHLDRLATQGMQFMNAYCPSAVCSPTRYALMTGNYPWRSWKKQGVMRNYEPSMMADSLLTLPEMLQENGYHTAGFGKWHLGAVFPTVDGENPVGYGQFFAEENGSNLDLTAEVKNGPIDHGFDEWLGFSCASECWIINNRNVVGALQHEKYNFTAAKGLEDIFEIPQEDYLPFITGKSIDYLKSKSNTEIPFFLYFAPYVPHVPLAVEDRFQGKSAAGLYGDYIEELDHYVGELLGILDSLNQSENTLIIFASDNGSQYVKINQTTDLDTAYSPKREIIPFNDAQYHYPNRPYRGNKWTVYDGGVRTPLIFHWPQRIQPGTVSNQLCMLNDIMPTIGTLINADRINNLTSDSHALSAITEAQNEASRDHLILQSSGNRFAIRKGDWKYISSVDLESQLLSSEDEELFNLIGDPGERVSLIAHEDERASSLGKTLADIVFGDGK